jgi:S1-C subfamily serine protease
VQAVTNGIRQRVQISDVEFKEVKLHLADGTEIPARVVLKDPDLDLAFIAPLPDAAKRAYVYADLAHPATAEVLGDYYVVARAAKILQRTPLVREVTIDGIAEKPRRLFVVNPVQLGCPVFDPQGRVLGVALNHISNGRPSGAVVMPAADLAQGARQAAEAAAKPAENAADADDAAPQPAPAGAAAGQQAPP